MTIGSGRFAGLIFSAIHAVAINNFRANRAGTVLNLFNLALAVFGKSHFYEKAKPTTLICHLVNLIFLWPDICHWYIFF